MITFGPVPSRRLGRSLGINNIPPKTCSYSCVYCQVGATSRCTTKRTHFHDVDAILSEAGNRVRKDQEKQGIIDYLTFVADGEPTLDINLGKIIRGLKPLNIKTAVITNASLLWKEDVSSDLMEADWISCKVDASDEKTWRNINKPHRSLSLSIIWDALLQFRERFKGQFVTETMLAGGINDSFVNVSGIAGFLNELKPETAYISIPIRPPARKQVIPPQNEMLIQAYHLFSQKNEKVECLTEYEGNDFTSTGTIQDDILSITAVHPMRREAVQELLDETGESWSLISTLIENGALKTTEYRGNTYYLRR